MGVTKNTVPIGTELTIEGYRAKDGGLKLSAGTSCCRMDRVCSSADRARRRRRGQTLTRQAPKHDARHEKLPRHHRQRTRGGAHLHGRDARTRTAIALEADGRRPARRGPADARALPAGRSGARSHRTHGVSGAGPGTRSSPRPGELVVWPAGTPHKWWNAGTTELRMTGWCAPPDNIEFFLGAVFASVKANGGNRPALFDAAFLMTRDRSRIRHARNAAVRATHRDAGSLRRRTRAREAR